MASHTLPLPVSGTSTHKASSFWLLCKIGDAAGVILALPFLALGSALTFSFLVLDAVFARNQKQRQ